jgi:hypothetical protein
MRQFIRAAAIAATLLLTPAAVPAENAAPTFRFSLAAPAAPSAAIPTVNAPAPAFGIAPGHEHDQGGGLAPGQAPADFTAWLERSPANRASLAAFERRLAAEGVDRVVPLWQLVRTASAFRQCGAAPFEVAPPDKWDNIVDTLKFVRDRVVPAVGEVEALSAYRNERLNACAAGAPRSAHRQFFALDLAPVSPAVDRGRMIRTVCAAHATGGRAYRAGLGFYSGRRFHVDSNGFRKWGPDGSGASSPCATGRYA